MPIYPSKTLSISIECPPDSVYTFVSNPENLPRWAGGFCQSVERSGDEWIATTPQGPMALRFVEENPYGVLDHIVRPSPDDEIINPMRVVPNGSGSELSFTLFQLPGMGDAQFIEDAGLVERDLQSLKEILESSGP